MQTGFVYDFGCQNLLLLLQIIYWLLHKYGSTFKRHSNDIHTTFTLCIQSEEGIHTYSVLRLAFVSMA
jgi:hypothetical protein